MLARTISTIRWFMVGCLLCIPVRQAQAEALAVLSQDAIKIQQKIQFTWGKSQILKDSYPVLAKVGEILRSHPQLRVRIEGHSDNRGSSRFNRILTQRRACSVRQYLITQEGIAASRLLCVGYGESRPLLPNVSSRNRKLNRRIAFALIKDKDSSAADTSAQPPGRAATGKQRLIHVLPQKIQLLRPITFQPGSWQFRRAALPVLARVAQVMQEHPGWRLRIEGHTARPPRHSIMLSYRRACAVKQYLVKHGIQEERIRCEGYGDTRPLASNRTAEGRQRNRRIELILRRR